jgi:hypothetical protein
MIIPDILIICAHLTDSASEAQQGAGDDPEEVKRSERRPIAEPQKGLN